MKLQQGDEFSALKDLLHDYSPVETASVFSGFLLDPEYQPHIYRIEFAIKASLSLCNGEKKPTRKLIRNILKKLKKQVLLSKKILQRMFLFLHFTWEINITRFF